MALNWNGWTSMVEQEKKHFSEIAEDLGLPKKIAWRKKKAAQYGSKFDKALQRLMSKAGFKFKKDYLNSLV